MPLVWRIVLLISLLFIVNSVLATTPAPKKENETSKEESTDSDEGESADKEKGTVPPEVMKKLKEEIIEAEEETAKEFGMTLTLKPEDVETYLEKQEKEYGTELPEVVEKDLAKTKTDDKLQNFAHFLEIFNKIDVAATENEEVTVRKTPEEMKKLKEENYKLLNELNEKVGLPEVPPEVFNEIWEEKKKEFGEHFPARAEKAAVALKKTIQEMDAKATETASEGSETETVTTTQFAEVMKEEPPPGTFALRNAKGSICILARFQSSITITYTGKTSDLKVEVTIPHSGHTKGKCRGPMGSALLQIAWGKFVFSLSFNKTTEDSWGATSVELTYDTSEPLFDGAVEREKITAKSKKDNLFETPFGKSYFCPAQEVILLYREEQHVATVRLKEIHLQPYEVEDGKFSPVHRCNQVVIGGPDEEPFVQDETVPLAVGLTLALITLLILVGFSVHRAYHAAKVDYNTME